MPGHDGDAWGAPSWSHRLGEAEGQQNILIVNKLDRPAWGWLLLIGLHCQFYDVMDQESIDQGQGIVAVNGQHIVCQ